MFSSLLLYPYFKWRHGKKIFKPFMEFSGLSRKLGSKPQPQQCTSNLDCINTGEEPYKPQNFTNFILELLKNPSKITGHLLKSD
jgi:hypothetical protein